MTEETPTTRKPKRSAKEIAQSHADVAVKALEKHDAKAAKVEEKHLQLENELGLLKEKRRELVREADYRAAHPLLVEDSDGSEPGTEQQGVDEPF